MSLEKLIDKYDPLKGKETPEVKTDAPFAPSIMRLTEYMKKHDDMGICLKQKNGMPHLYFDPGLRHEDANDRWQIAINAVSLFFDASDDLIDMINKGQDICHLNQRSNAHSQAAHV